MLNDGIDTLTYDAENCLTSNTNTSTGTTYYTCDAAGVRVKKAMQSGTTTVYIFGGDMDIAEYNNGSAPGSPSREFLYAGPDLLASISGTNTTYHHKDHLSVRLYTDVNGQVTGQQATYPFGESWYSTLAADQFAFTTYQRDSESGNDYAMARYYINRFGRFSCADPLMGNPVDPQSWNRYAYVRNDPINMIDPSGQGWLTILLSVLIDVVSAITLQPEGIALGQAIGLGVEEGIGQGVLAEAFSMVRQEIRQAGKEGQQGQSQSPPQPQLPQDTLKRINCVTIALNAQFPGVGFKPDTTTPPPSKGGHTNPIETATVPTQAAKDIQTQIQNQARHSMIHGARYPNGLHLPKPPSTTPAPPSQPGMSTISISGHIDSVTPVDIVTGVWHTLKDVGWGTLKQKVSGGDIDKRCTM